MTTINHAEQVKSAIEKSEHSRYEICKATGLDHSNLGKMISGRIDFTPRAILKLAEYFGMRFTRPKKPSKSTAPGG